MHLHDHAGFAICEPSAKKIQQGILTTLGPHHKWSGNGHKKLAAIRFPIWGVCDKWSSMWLGLWVIPNNHLKLAIALLYLQLIKDQGGEFMTTSVHVQCSISLGMPIQTSTDCGSETTEVFGLANALR